MMAGPALAFNSPFLEEQLPAYVRRAWRSAPRRTPTLQAAARRRTRRSSSRRRTSTWSCRHVTFTDRLTIELGERHIEVLNYGRGVTPGDTFVYLPNEKILLLGDLIVNPITFALSGFPTEWLRVLERIDALDATTIVTGHGAPLHDKTLLRRDDGRVPGAVAGGQGGEGEGPDAGSGEGSDLPRPARSDGDDHRRSSCS